MRLFLIRHGEKEKGAYFNSSLNHQDPPLSRSGQRDARKLVGWFRGKSIKAIYASAYRRTYETSLHLSKTYKIQPVIDARLNEIDNGIIESLSDEEIKKQYPVFWEQFFSYS